MLGGSQGLGGTSQRTGGLWPLASAPVSPATTFTSDGYSKYGFYSLFSGAPTFGSTLYSHNTLGRFGPALQAPGATAFHTTHKVSDSLFSATGYTFGAPTPPPGSPYSPVPVAQLEFLAKGYTTTTNSNIIIQQSPLCHQPQELSSTPSPTKKNQHIIITPTSEKDFKMSSNSNGSAFRSSQSTFKHHHQQAQYIYQPSNQSLDGCMLKLTTLTSSSDKDCHSTGCSRTNPLEWTTLSPIHVKKEPGALMLGDLNHGAHHHQAEAIIKMEMPSPVQKHQELIQQAATSMPSIVTTNGNIPVGIAVGRQRIQQEVAPSGILTTTHFKEVARISEIADLNAAAAHHAAHAHQAAALQHQHHQHHIQHHQQPAQTSTGATAAADCWGLMSGQQPLHCHPGAQNASGTLWTTAQYPAPLPMEPLLPMSAVGLPLQLIREPTSGGFLLFPTAGIEPVQQAAAIQLWPTGPSTATYPTSTPGHVLLPPLPPPPLQLLTSAQQAQQESYQHLSTAMITSSSCTNNSNSNCGLISTISNNNSGLASVNTINQSSARLHLLSSNNVSQNIYEQVGTKLISSKSVVDSKSAVIKVEEGALMMRHHQQPIEEVTPANLQIYESSPPLLTATHVIYQPSPSSANSNNHLSNAPQSDSLTPDREELVETIEQPWKHVNQSSVVAACRSQATSPVACLTPPPETCNTDRCHEITDSGQKVLENVLEKREAEEKFVQDAGNQTEAISDEEPAILDAKSSEDINVPNLAEDLNEDNINIEDLTIVRETDVAELPQIEAEQVEVPKPDFSGLDLLSNSILEHETSKIKVQSPKVSGVVAKPLPLVEENLGGLDLLCALAEQRLEEVASQKAIVKKPELVKTRRDAIDFIEDEPEVKKAKIEEDLPRRCNNCNCSVDDEPFKSYKTKESEQEFKKFIASKAPSLMEYNYKEMAANGSMNDSERDMRQQLADLQRKYKEKQRELNKLKPQQLQQKKKHRKKSTNSSTDRDGSPLPPVLEPQVDLATLLPTQRSEILKPCETTTATTEIANDLTCKIEKRRISSSNSTISKRRRKVGRPKKLEWSSDNESSRDNPTSTETIVAKKPKKAHQNLVSFLLAAKEKLLVQNVYSTDSPPRFVEEAPISANKKIGPKLKAEARVSMEMFSDDFAVTDEENKMVSCEANLAAPDELTMTTQEDSTPTKELEDENVDDDDDDSTGNLLQSCNKEEPQRQVAIDADVDVDTRCVLTTELLESDRLRVLTAMGGLFYAGNLNAVQPPDVYSITLDGERGNRPHIMSREEILRDAIVEVSPSSTEDLAAGTRLCAYWSQQYRCLYPGSVAEPASPNASPRETERRFVAVEFDDGDNGTIAIEDIRLLPPDYPIIEYDPNPLLSLSKRKRRLSTTEERKFTQSPPISSFQTKESPLNHSVEKENKDLNTNTNQQTDSDLKVQRNKERKRLKKRKREKLREKRRCLSDGEILKKKKKRKHKCLGEQCKHRRHHKKHKKHHRRHQKRDGREKNISRREEKVLEKDVETVEEAEEVFPEYHIVPNPDEEVTMDDIIDANANAKSKKIRDRQESCESRSKMSAFLPPRQFWSWSGKGYKRPRGKGRSKKEFFKSIQRGKENMSVGDSAVFLSTGRPDRPYIGKIEAFWETCGTMVVKVKWFYHPEETNGCPLNLKYPGALFESPHVDENDVQTISHRCRVVQLSEYTATLGSDPTRYATIYDNNDIYYRAGYYDPTTSQLSMDTDIPLEEE